MKRLTNTIQKKSLENDSPSRGRKQKLILNQSFLLPLGLENDSPSRGQKLCVFHGTSVIDLYSLENDSPSRGRKPIPISFCLSIIKRV